ncbi:MAG: hypothetical protein EPN23_10765 [Verrucomicrobia bacterium]|nr:MAG: hypothetical protein EPN23_10765 [Verrucomicrobiota bacterium]
MKSPAKKSSSGVSRARRVEMNFLERVRRRCPAYRPVNEVLGDLYTKIGRFEEGLELDLTLSQTHPGDPYVWYNLACSYALTGKSDDAFDALDHAVRLGYADRDWLLKDDNLETLHTDPRFALLLKKLAK